MGGMVLETNMNEIVSRFLEQDKLEKSEVRKLFICRAVILLKCQILLATSNLLHIGAKNNCSKSLHYVV